MKGIPQPFPYQGSKRQLASRIVACLPHDTETLFEPFAGSAAVSIAAAYQRRAKKHQLNDVNAPLADLWRAIIGGPEELLAGYQRHWKAQLGREREYYDAVRDEFNKSPTPASFLYLLARCIKGAIRYNREGHFNQSPDNRRLGMKPETLTTEILSVNALLKGKTRVTALDYEDAVANAGPRDVIYMDPPYQGVSGDRDARYIRGLLFDKFVATLETLNRRQLSYVVSYDGRTGAKAYGKPLPEKLGVKRIELPAGRSTQATLLGRQDTTVESLYLSAPLIDRLNGVPKALEKAKSQLGLQFAMNA